MRKKNLKCDNTNIKNCICANNINILENSNEHIIDQILKDIKQISEIINKKLKPIVINMNRTIDKTLLELPSIFSTVDNIYKNINNDSTKYDNKIKKDLKDEMTYLDQIKKYTNDFKK